MTIVGIGPPGFFGETLRSDPPDIWIPLQQEPILRGSNSLLHRFPAWLRVIGRTRPGASTSVLPARLTDLLRVWLVNDSGMPAEWMSGLKQNLSQAGHPSGAGGRGRSGHEGGLRQTVCIFC